MSAVGCGPSIPSARNVSPSPWWLVLFLVGLDYFSTLAYLPSVAVEAAGPLAPWAAAVVVTVTLLFAVPLYTYVVGRSPHGRGATGLLEQCWSGWRCKLLVLVLMGFVATDFVITRSLSIADASVHFLQNPFLVAGVDQVAPDVETIHRWLGPTIGGYLQPYWNRQVGVTLALASFAFALLFWMHQGFSRKILRVALAVVVVYLALNALLLACGAFYLLDHPELVQSWRDQAWEHTRLNGGENAGTLLWIVLALGLASFPQLALGLSGFELSMSIAPLVDGHPADDPETPRGRIRNTRKLILLAAVIMSVYVLASVAVTTVLIPPSAFGPDGPARHRALAYLAHGGPLADGRPAAEVLPLCGGLFGTLYDFSTIAILCLAGASVMIGLRDLVPQYLHRMGMELHWANRIGLMIHLFNVIILLITLVFRASVAAQQWAYATSVLVLLTGAALAAVADLRQRWRGSWLRPVVLAPFGLILAFFLGMSCLTIGTNRSGLAIASLFVGTIVATSFVSRWLRSTELRFQSFTFASERDRARWEAICQLEFQVLVPHRPGKYPLPRKNEEVRKRHRLPPETILIFIEAEVGDASEFTQQPLMKIVQEEGLEVIRVSRCVSVAHVIAAIALEFRHVGRPPEILFGWSHERPLAANLSFLLLGEGNIPWMVKELIRHAEPDESRQPLIVVG